MIPLGQCIVCMGICWDSRKGSVIVRTPAGFMHKLCYLYRGKRLIDKLRRKENVSMYRREKQVWI